MGFRFFKKKDIRSERQAKVERRKTAGARRIAASGLLLACLLWISALVLIYSGGTGSYSNLTVGQRAPYTVVASVDFTCEDIAKTELSRLQAANSVPPVFTIDHGKDSSIIRTVDKLYDRVAELQELAADRKLNIDIDAELDTVLDLLGVDLTPQEMRQLAPRDREDEVRTAIKKALRETWTGGVISDDGKKTGYGGIAASGTIVIRRPDGSFAGPLEIAELPLPGQALDDAVKQVLEQTPGIRISKSTLSSFLKPWITPNLAYDPQVTQARRESIGGSVDPVRTTIRAGTTLVEDGERITPQIIEQLSEHEKRKSELESPFDRTIRKIGNAGLLMVALIACIGLVQIMAPDVASKESKILLLIVLSLFVILPAKGLLYLSGTLNIIPPGVVEFVVPLSLAPLLASILLGVPVAIPIGLWVSFATSVLFDNNLEILTLGLIATVIAALSTRNVRQRSRIYRAGLFIGLAKVLYAISLGAITQQSVQVVANQALAGLIGGLVAAFLAALLIPLFEMLFNITTDLTLLELSDMSHPLLQRLAMEAPGTYHHSIVVANLGEAAATRIGANPLLVRVGAYYHDIGKLAKPEFFSENMNLRDNPHDDLSPSMSTLVITSHVKEGSSLARRFKLPRCVVDAVEQHHGTGIVSFFYHRAKKEAEQANGSRSNGKTVDESSFRYEGPKPDTREMGILALADSVEAASRSLEKPTPGRIEALVDDIVAKKIADGQLDDCELTLYAISEIKRSFVFTLANMLHVRVAYPQDETKSGQQPGKDTRSGETAEAADTVAARESGDKA